MLNKLNLPPSKIPKAVCSAGFARPYSLFQSVSERLTSSLLKCRRIEGLTNRRFDLHEVARGVALDSILEEIER